MSHFLRHYQLSDEWDISWTICSSASLLILIFILFSSIKTLQRICCINQVSAAGVHHKLETKYFIAYSRISVISATISAILIFSIFPVCSQWNCWHNMLENIYYALWWNFYFLSKLFLYLIFVGRLMNPYFIQIYQYSKFVEYSLWMLLIALIMVMITFNITYGLVLSNIQYPSSINIIISAVYGITDCILSISLMISFFRPICNKFSSANVYRTVVKKYAILSSLQVIVAVSAQAAVVIATLLYWTDASRSTLRVYADIRNVLQMLDCLLLIICIYSGFARQQTVRKCAQNMIDMISILVVCCFASAPIVCTNLGHLLRMLSVALLWWWFSGNISNTGCICGRLVKSKKGEQANIGRGKIFGPGVSNKHHGGD